MASQPSHFDSTFPTVPTSLSTDGHGMRDHYAVQDHTTERPSTHTLQDITPYLGLRARLSQVWVNRWTVLILLVLVRVLIATGNLHHDLDSAKVRALSACTSVESMGSAMASMPHYMSQGTNELAAKGVEKAVNGLESMLFMAVTALEEIFVFVINMMYGTYECLITLAVGTAGHAAIAVAEDAAKFLNDTLKEITDDIGKGVDGFQDGVNKVFSKINNIFNHDDPPKLNLDGPLDKLRNLKIPSSVQDELAKLDKTIPNFDQVHNATNTVLKMPFELIKKEMREHLGNFEFDKSAFPVPERKQLSFCSDDDGINSFFDGLYKIAETARKTITVVLLVAAVIACVPMVWLEIRRWRTMQERAAFIKQSAVDPMDVIYMASRPYTAAAGMRLSGMFGSRKKQVLSRWFVAYVTSLPALVVLAIALAGLFSCLCQYILLQAVRKEVPALANTVGAFAQKVVDALATSSNEWSNGTNAVILAKNTEINHNVLGWVNTSTTAVNHTLNSFVDETTHLLDKAFGGTVLYDPIKGIFDCLVGLKVEALQNGLTWAHVDFPLFPNDTFSAGASKALASGDPKTGASPDSFMADPQSGATDKITSAVFDLTDKLTRGIRTEALISTAVLGVYLALVLFALVYCLFTLARRDKARAEGGASYAGDISTSNASPRTRSMALPATNHQNEEAPVYERFAAFRGPSQSFNENEKEHQWNSNEPANANPRGHMELGSYQDKKAESPDHSLYGIMEGEK
jgi:hypothetical protein